MALKHRTHTKTVMQQELSVVTNLERGVHDSGML